MLIFLFSLLPGFSILEVFQRKGLISVMDTFNPTYPIPVNIRNVFKWFKHLQNVFKT